MKKRKVFLETNGCISRSLDLARMKDYFLKNNCELVAAPTKADDIVFLGCAAVKQEEDWSLQRIHDFKNLKANLIVGGCIKEMSGKKFPESQKERSINTRNHEDIDLFFPEFKQKFNDVPDANEGMPRNLRHYMKNNVLNFREFKLSFFRKLVQYYHTRFRKSFVIRIGRGCEEKCTFCSIWRAIGPNRSKSLECCLSELKKATQKNIKLINLVSDHLGAYGLDIGKTLPELIHKMIEQAPDVVFILEELHPKWFMAYQDEIYELIKQGKIFSLHMPIQSGSDRILRRMNRNYKMKDVYTSFSKIKQINPKVKLYTDVIIGFPTETDDDLNDSINFIKDVGFDSLCYFEYDSKYDSPNMKEFPKEIVKKRVNRLTTFLWKNRIGGAPF